ncbi:MAG: peptidoglycan-binding protein [Azospirillum sp.]|nr:peptidoglycan-binding protein [Azospirillum sp.]
MSFSGQDVIDIGSTRIGQDYVFGARVPLDNPNWKGPWDCAEFASWCVYQAYGMIFGAGNVSSVSKADPYSGNWYSEAKKYATVITPEAALNIPGALLVRAPAQGKIGHVSLAMGDGNRTLEARGKAYGVGVFDRAAARPWSIGVLLPGVDYGAAAPAPHPLGQPVAEIQPIALPAGYLWLKTPAFAGAEVIALQRALVAKEIDPGPLDGEFGPMTSAAVISYQAREGLEVDGMVGPATAKKLGLGFPIAGTAQDARVREEALTPPGPTTITLPPAGTFDAVVDIVQKGKTFHAKTASGFTFVIGSSVPYTDDMHRIGLFQGGSDITDSLKFGTYKAADFLAAFGKWAHFIEPTLAAEGNARFATLNSYDRAAFTFGAPQLAAHTPGENFVVYLRALLGLPDADKHFPELSLRKNAAGHSSIHLAKSGGFEDLETVVEVTRPNGKKDKQPALLMKYLNPSPTAIDAAELSAAARLMNWLRLDAKAKELQIAVFVATAQKKIALAKTKVAGFDGKGDWRIALWIMDILHQGRGTYREMSAAMATADPASAMQKIGEHSYKSRVKTVAAAVSALMKTGVMDGFEV